jgi:dual specificity MAP kinase phosphatase
MKFINWLLVKWQVILNFLSRYILGYSSLKTIRVTPKVYLGGFFWKRKIPRLKKWGITAVVNMRTSKPLAGIKTLHLPTRDHHAPTLKDLEKGAAFIQDEVDRGGKVYVHCKAGIGRGPTMVIAYLITTGYELTEAIELIKKVRIFIRPNKIQLARLAEFEVRHQHKIKSDSL